MFTHEKSKYYYDENLTPYNKEQEVWTLDVLNPFPGVIKA